MSMLILGSPSRKNRERTLRGVGVVGLFEFALWAVSSPTAFAAPVQMSRLEWAYLLASLEALEGSEWRSFFSVSLLLLVGFSLTYMHRQRRTKSAILRRPMATRTRYVVVRTVFRDSVLSDAAPPKSSPIGVFETLEKAQEWVESRHQAQGRNEYAVHAVLSDEKDKTFFARLKAVFGR